MAKIQKISIPTRLFVSCLILLSITSGIRSQHVENQYEPAKYTTYSNYNDFKLGYGIRPNDVPIVECAQSKKTRQLNCSLQIRTGARCYMDIGNDSTTAIGLDHLVQLSENKLIFMFESVENRGDLIIESNIYTVDMDTCKNAIISGYFGTFPKIVKQEDGFDVLVDGNKIKRYNIDGELIRELKLDLSNGVCEDFRVMAENFFVVASNEFDNTIEVVNRHGKTIKSILSFRRNYGGYAIQSDQSAYTICWKSVENTKNTIHCKQFDEFGNENFSQLTEVDYEGLLLDVRRLQAGGVVVFSVGSDYPKNWLHVTTMRTDHGAVTLSYLLFKRDYDQMTTVIDFNEDDGTFELAYTSMDGVEDVVYVQKFNF